MQTIRFNNFEIRPYHTLDGHTDPNRYEVVKWYKTESPIEVTSVPSGEKIMKDTFCYVIAWLYWNPKEPCWEFESVGTRFIDDYEDGLCEYIKAYINILNLVRESVEE